MFSVIQNITSALNPLEAKAVDARLEKKRHNPIDIDEEHNSDNSDNSVVMEESESSNLSIKALILFLEDFLEARLGTKPVTDSSNTQQDSFAPWFKASPSNDGVDIKSKKATNAYKHGLEVLRAPLKTFKGNTPDVSRQEELKNIYSLIVDLRQLQDSGVRYLDIGSKKTFIDGISFAVDTAKRAQNK